MVVYKYSRTPLVGELHDYTEEVKLHKVDETKWEALWDRMVQKHHYLGYGGVIGARVKYIITLGEHVIGAISFCSAAYHLGPRDEYIGWDAQTRLAMLPHLVSNNRFLILPWISIRNLASRVLSMSLRQLREDWAKQYETVPYMVETFVDRTNYLGTCYKAANWTYLGVTKGYGKTGGSFVYHGKKKDIYVYILDRGFAREFRPDTSRLANEKGELAAMINGIPMWYPSLLKEVGVSDNPMEQIKQRFNDHLWRYIPFLGRKEHWRHLVTMVQGLLSDLKRKSIEPIAMAFEGIDSVRNVTNFMSKSKWDDAAMLAEYQSDLSETVAAEDGMITGDETGIPKKGNESVGVARQYCGRTGKTDNCQVGVMLGYASSSGYGIVDFQLFMPESWFGDGHAQRRRKCKVPSSLSFRTKGEMLQGMIQAAVDSGKFPAKYIGVDSAYGSSGTFLDSLPEGLIYFADVRNNCHVFDGRPEVRVPPYSGRGKRPTKEKPEFPSITVKELIEQQDETAWSKMVLGIGAKGPVIAEDIALRVVESRGGLPGKEVWLYVRKLENGTIKYALCNAPGSATAEGIRKPALMRWSIEQCFGECKDYLGMDHYESRSWLAWHRHMLLTFIAHLFITKLRIAYSAIPRTPSATPYTDTPVHFEDYLEAFEQMKNDQPILHPDIMAKPTRPQQFLTIGLIQKLISTAFVKAGAVMCEINHLLYKAMSAFNSHSIAKMNDATLNCGDG